MMSETKREILAYIFNMTKKYNVEDVQYFSAHAVSEELSISRSLASQHLNELFREGLLIKINTRPVLFYHHSTLSSKHKSFIKYREYNAVETLVNELDNIVLNGGFFNLIGHQGSLKEVVESAKVSVSYGQVGLPLILIGKANTGKKTIARTMYNHIKNNEFMPEAFGCNIYDFHEDNQYDIKEFERIVSNNPTGFYYLSNIHLLSKHHQVKLKKFILDQKANDRFFVLSTQETLSNTIWDEKFIQVTVPDFNTRPKEEKIEMMISFFKNAMATFGKVIYVKASILDVLADYYYAYELQDLMISIQHIVGRANSADSKDIKIFVFHFQDWLDRTKIDDLFIKFEKEEFFAVTEYNSHKYRYKDFYDQIIFDVTDSEACLDSYVNYLEKDENYDQEKVDNLEAIVNRLIMLKKEFSEDIFINEHSRLISLIIYILPLSKQHTLEWLDTNQQEVAFARSYIEENFVQSDTIIQNLEDSIYNYTGFRIDAMHALILRLLHMYRTTSSLQSYLDNSHLHLDEVYIEDSPLYDDDIKVKLVQLNSDDNYINYKRLDSQHFHDYMGAIDLIRRTDHDQNCLAIFNDALGSIKIDLITKY